MNIFNKPQTSNNHSSHFGKLLYHQSAHINLITFDDSGFSIKLDNITKQ